MRRKLFSLQQLSQQEFPNLWVLVVIGGCMGLFGIGFSTHLAHFFQASCALVPLVLLGQIRTRSAKSEQYTETGHQIAASYARFSSDMQDDRSITGQQRKCRERAERDGQLLLPELEFVDEAVSGTKPDRDGLQAMLEAARQGQFQILYIENLSRLARESVLSLSMTKDLVHNHKIRIISLDEGIDSDQANWDFLTAIFSVQHEQYLRTLSHFVRRGQEGVVLEGLSVGDWRFGYRSEPIPGSEQNRRGRDVKPRMRLVIEPSEAAWTSTMFQWFVEQGQSKRAIAKELNRLGVSPGPRAPSGRWSAQLVSNLLRNQKYIGIWEWGKTRSVRNPLTGKTHAEPVPPEEYQKWTRELPKLRIVDDELYYRAQAILDENARVLAEHRSNGGRFTGSPRHGKGRNRRHLLAGLIRCASCGARFYVGGSRNRYMFCPNYRHGLCTCQTQLRRDRAERLILEVVRERILGDSHWLACVVSEARTTWREFHEGLPEERESVNARLTDVERKIQRLLDQVEEGEVAPEFKARLLDRRREKEQLSRELGRLEQACSAAPPEPTADEIQSRMQELPELLSRGGPPAADALAAIVGGQIVVKEIREPGKLRHYLQGELRLQTRQMAISLLGAMNSPTENDEGPEGEHVAIDFIDPPDWYQESEETKRLYDEGMVLRDIAKQFGCSRAKITKLLNHWFDCRDLQRPDNFARGRRLMREDPEGALHRRLADQIKTLSDEGLLLQEIAERLGCDRHIVTWGFRWWHESRGLKAPDGRTRRKSLDRKASGPRMARGAKEGPSPQEMITPS